MADAIERDPIFAGALEEAGQRPVVHGWCALRLDTRIAGLARALGARYTRYADDIVLSGDAALRRWADCVETRIGAWALDEGFALNHRKTRRVTHARRQ